MLKFRLTTIILRSFLDIFERLKKMQNFFCSKITPCIAKTVFSEPKYFEKIFLKMFLKKVFTKNIFNTQVSILELRDQMQYFGFGGKMIWSNLKKYFFNPKGGPFWFRKKRFLLCKGVIFQTKNLKMEKISRMDRHKIDATKYWIFVQIFFLSWARWYLGNGSG